MAVLQSCAGLDRSRWYSILAMLTGACALQSAYASLIWGGSLVLTRLHGLVLYSTCAEIGYRRTYQCFPALHWTFLLQDMTCLRPTVFLHRRTQLRRDKTHNVCFSPSPSQAPPNIHRLALSNLDPADYCLPDRLPHGGCFVSSPTPRTFSSFSILV